MMTPCEIYRAAFDYEPERCGSWNGTGWCKDEILQRSVEVDFDEESITILVERASVEVSYSDDEWPRPLAEKMAIAAARAMLHTINTAEDEGEE